MNVAVVLALELDQPSLEPDVSFFRNWRRNIGLDTVSRVLLNIEG
jgi:hypothetical protein